jgi:hypothetical protein
MYIVHWSNLQYGMQRWCARHMCRAQRCCC